MAFGFSSSSITLLIGIILLVSCASTNSRPLSLKNLTHHEDDHHQGMDPSVNIFFKVENLKIGNKMSIYFSNKNLSNSPHLLSRDFIKSIPFSSSSLSYLLEFFSLSKDSPQAKAMEYTLTLCELQPIKGETRFCATSLESMLDFVTDIFGEGEPNLSSSSVKVLTTTHLTKLSHQKNSSLQNYTILEKPSEVYYGGKMISCHTLPYPYAVFYCHFQESKNRLFEILLGGRHGEKVRAAAVCHMDTSHWNRDHPSFRVLKMEPGTQPVCHFFPEDNLVFVLQ